MLDELEKMGKEPIKHNESSIHLLGCQTVVFWVVCSLLMDIQGLGSRHGMCRSLCFSLRIHDTYCNRICMIIIRYIPT
jgi:hypothetical protein